MIQAMYPQLDPECREVREFNEAETDPMTQHYGAEGMVAETFARSHYKTCGRCRRAEAVR